MFQVPKEFDVYEEVELGVIIGQKCKNVKACESMKYVGGYCLALDLTAVNDMVSEILISFIKTIAKESTFICCFIVNFRKSLKNIFIYYHNIKCEVSVTVTKFRLNGSVSLQ